MDGYHIDRAYLAPDPRPQPALAHGIAAVIRRARRYDLVHVSGEAAAALCFPLLASRPSVVTLHGLHLVRRTRGLRRAAAVLALRAVVAVARRTVCVSDSEHALLTRTIGRSPRAVVIRNGVILPGDLGARAAVRAELGLSESEPVALWVGSLDERKDPLTAIRAAAQAEVTLLLAGDGPLRPALPRSARTRVLGARRDVPRLLEAADVLVLTSRREGLSLALLEALPAGLPPVATDLPVNGDALGDAGLVDEAGSDEAFAGGIQRALAERAQLAQAARARAAAVFPASKMIEATRALYGAVLGERQPRKRPFPTAQ
jgi:glycosyltransferase involved in cell wall biosynthesis